MYVHNLRKAAALLIAGSLGILAHAQESEHLSIEDIQAEATNSTNKVPGADIDSEITNNRLRAASGSKSRFSLASELNYLGSSIDEPWAESRPNITGLAGQTTSSLISGVVKGKYNFDQANSLMAGGGLRYMMPFTDTQPKKGSKFDVENPFLMYQNISKIGGVQSVLQVQGLWYTNSDQREDGFQSYLLVQQDNMYQFTGSGWSLGFYVYAQGNTFDKTRSGAAPGQVAYDPKEDVQARQSDYAFGIDPEVEYQFNDHYNFRSVLNVGNFEHYRNAQSVDDFRYDKAQVSVGLGIKVTRDIFLYPNVQFLPLDPDFRSTNVALNTNINFF